MILAGEPQDWTLIDELIDPGALERAMRDLLRRRGFAVPEGELPPEGKRKPTDTSDPPFLPPLTDNVK